MDNIAFPQRRQCRLHDTDVCLMPHSRTVVRCPGIRFNIEQKTSLPKQENMVLSIGVVSGSRESDLWHRATQAFGVLGTDDHRNFKMPARRISSCESAAAVPVPRSGAAICSGYPQQSGRIARPQRAAGNFRVVGLNVDGSRAQHGNFLVLLPIVTPKKVRIRGHRPVLTH